jgi:flagellin-specific chaperone FliS
MIQNEKTKKSAEKLLALYEQQIAEATAKGDNKKIEDVTKLRDTLKKRMEDNTTTNGNIRENATKPKTTTPEPTAVPTPKAPKAPKEKKQRISKKFKILNEVATELSNDKVKISVVQDKKLFSIIINGRAFFQDKFNRTQGYLFAIKQLNLILEAMGK